MASAGHRSFKANFDGTTTSTSMPPAAYQYPFYSGPSYDMDRNNQGWGMPDLKSLYDSRNNMVILNEPVSLGGTQNYQFFVTAMGGGVPLKATLVWRDPAGTPNSQVHRVNDLDLVVSSQQTGYKYYGNDGLADGLWSVHDNGMIDDRNTVENIFIESPEAGEEYEVVVQVAELNADGYPADVTMNTRFALVISGVEGGSPVMMGSDWNRDGSVDLADLRAFLSDFVKGQADVDGNGATIPSDVSVFVESLFDGITTTRAP